MTIINYLTKKGWIYTKLHHLLLVIAFCNLTTILFGLTKLSAPLPSQ